MFSGYHSATEKPRETRPGIRVGVQNPEGRGWGVKSLHSFGVPSTTNFGPLSTRKPSYEKKKKKARHS